MLRFRALISVRFLFGCTQNRVALLVDLKTDLVPVLEFDSVVSQLEMDGTPISDPQTVDAESSFSAFNGSRIANFSDLKEGDYRLMVWLKRGDTRCGRAPGGSRSRPRRGSEAGGAAAGEAAESGRSAIVALDAVVGCRKVR